MTACTPIGKHGQVVRTGDSQEAQRKRICWCTRKRVIGKQPGKGRPVRGARFHAAVIHSMHRIRMRHSRRSIEIRNAPGERAARTRGPRRIRGQLAEQDDSLDRADNTWRTHRGRAFTRRRGTQTEEDDHHQAWSKGPLARGSTQATRARTQVPSARRNTRAATKEREGPSDSTKRGGPVEWYRNSKPRVDLVLLNMCAYRGVDPRRSRLVGQTVSSRDRPLVSASRRQYFQIGVNTPRSSV